MQRPQEKQETPQYEMMASVDKTDSVKKASFEMQPPGKGSDIEIPQVEMDCKGGVYEVIANTDSGFQKLESKPAERGHEAVYESLTAITLATQQQMLLFRRMMYLISLLLVIALLTAAASLGLTVVIMMSGKTLGLNQPTSAPGRYPVREEFNLLSAGYRRSDLTLNIIMLYFRQAMVS